MSQVHQVRRAHFRLQVGGEAVSEQQRSGWQVAFEQQIVPLLDKALSEWVQTHLHHPSDVVSLSRLQFDLGPLGDPFDVDRLRQMLHQQLDWQLAGLRVSSLSTQAWRVRCYLHFLQKGYWPAASPFRHMDEVESFLSEAGGTLLPDLHAALQKAPAASPLWRRIHFQHSEHFIRWLAQHLAQAEVVDTFQRAWKSVSLTPAWLPVALLFVAVKARSLVPVSELAKQLSQRLKQLAGPSKTLQENLFEQFFISLDEILQVPKNNLEDVPAEGAADDTEALTLQTESLLVKQAGLVLLHPFLADFFANCGWLRSRQFFNRHAQIHALFALHLLATGRQQDAEHELLLEKFLVGLPLAMPLPNQVELDVSIVNQVTELLQAAIGHWSALKNTSVDAFRETFLQREGSLQAMDEGYRLTVQSQGVDLLIDRLPWSLSFITLPWLDKPLFVQWRAP